MPVLPYPAPELSDGAVRLRRFDIATSNAFDSPRQTPRIPKHTTVPRDFTDAEGIAFIERQWSRQTNGEGVSLAIADASTDEAAGLIVALFRGQPGVVELGYWVVPPARGRGLASRAVALLAPWLLTDTPTTRVQAIVEPSNTPSRRTLAARRFREEGLLRSYLDGELDVVMYSLLQEDLSSG